MDKLQSWEDKFDTRFQYLLDDTTTGWQKQIRINTLQYFKQFMRQEIADLTKECVEVYEKYKDHAHCDGEINDLDMWQAIKALAERVKE